MLWKKRIYFHSFDFWLKNFDNFIHFGRRFYGNVHVSFLFHDDLKMAVNVHVAVKSSYFLQLTKTGNGGAIEITSQAKNVQVNNCFFEELCVSQSGGSIYISSNSTIVYCCKFHRSYSTDRRDADGSGTSLGNVFYQVTGHGVFDNCVTFCCSYSRDKCTDSCIRFNSMCVITNYNASSNCGIGGGSGFSLRNAPSSTISYINVVDLTCEQFL